MHGSDRCSSHLGRATHPTSLTGDVVDRLVAMLRQGNYVQVAARVAGISRQTFYVWMQRGTSSQPADAPFVDFRERVEEALALGEARNVALIAKAAPDNWQAAAWLLERQYPQRWGRVSTQLRRELDESELARQAAERRGVDPFAEVDELAEKRQQRSR